VYQQGGQQFRSLIETSRLTPAATRQSNDKPLSSSFLLTAHSVIAPASPDAVQRTSVVGGERGTRVACARTTRSVPKIPTLRQRFLGLADGSSESRRRLRLAWQWARERLPDHEIHADGQTLRLFPEGGLDAAAAFGDEELRAFADWIILAQLSYDQFV
jgi:hypothetical protein